MPPEAWPNILNTIYKLTSLGVGFASIYLGFRLFMAGIWGASGDLDVKFNDNSVVLKSAAPGTFFAFFGACIILLTVWQGLNLEYRASVVAVTDEKDGPIEVKVEATSSGLEIAPSRTKSITLPAVKAERIPASE